MAALSLLSVRPKHCQALLCVEAPGHPLVGPSHEKLTVESWDGGPRASVGSLAGRARFWGEWLEDQSSQR